MAKLAINILIEKRKDIDKDPKIYSIISILLHALVLVLLFLNAGYARYKLAKKPKVYRVSIATLPTLENGGKKKAKIEAKRAFDGNKKARKKAKKKNKVVGINTQKVKQTTKKRQKEKGKQKATTTKNTSQSKGSSGGVKKGFKGSASSIMNLDTTSFDYAYYLAIVRDKIGNNWVRTYTGAGKVKIYFKIMKNGEIRDARVEISSGNAGLDRLALEAVLKSNPFPPLPEGFREDYIGIHIWFNYEE